MRTGWILLCLAACGDVVATPDAPTPDAAPVARCNPTARFGPPQPVAALNTSGYDSGARLSADERTVIFSRVVGNVAGLFIATRGGPTEQFSTPSALAGTPNTFSPSLTGDSLNLYTSAPVAGRTDYGIYVATRASATQAFGGPTLITQLDSPSDEGDPYMLADHSRIYFHRRVTGNLLTLWTAARSSSGFSTPQQIDELVAATSTSSPVVSPDQLTIYFAKATPTAPGTPADYDIWVAKRSSPAIQFDPPVLVPELNSSETEWPTWSSTDGCVLYLARGNQTGDIYVAMRGT